MFELMVAAKLLLTAPNSIVGIERARIEKKFGRPASIGTDFRPSPTLAGETDRVVTLDWPQLRVRLYESAATSAVALLSVTTTKDMLPADSPIHIGVDRGTVLRELGGPIYEDENQVVYSLQEEDRSLPNSTVRIVFENDRIIGLDWTFPLE